MPSFPLPNGSECREQILRMLPAGYELEGRRLLDFGCGAGRTLSHFLDQADSAEIWGCDIDAESIDWLQRNLCPPLHALRNEAEPALPFADGHFDLVWALSVFTHLVDTWAPWLLELHRVLADDGILIATTIGPRHSEHFAEEGWDEDRIGMNALRHWASWEAGGPVVLHSTWWLRAHWGRAFEVLEIDESPVGVAPTNAACTWSGFTNHRWLAMRKRDLALTVADLERPEPGEQRELSAARHNVRQLRGELDLERTAADDTVRRLQRELDRAHGRLAEHEQRLRDQGQRLRDQGQRLREQAQRPREQQKLLRAMLRSRAFAVAEQLSRLRGRGRPLFSRQQIKRALGDEDGPA